MKGHIKFLAQIVPIILIFLGLVTAIKVYSSGSQEFQKGQALQSENKLEDAVTHYERAIRWYLPGLGVQEKSAQHIWDIAGKFESQNKSEHALNTYRLLRSAFYSSRSFYTPGQKWIDQCNEKISALMARKPPYAEADKNKTYAQRKAEYMKILSAEKSPHHIWAIVTEAGFFGWVACAFLIIVMGFQKTGEIRPKPALLWSFGCAVFYGVWLLGMYKL